VRILDRRRNDPLLAALEVGPPSKACFWTTYLLFGLSLALPVCRYKDWGMGSGGSQLHTMYGYEFLVCGFLGNAGFLVGLLGFSLPRWAISFGIASCILGFVQGLFMLIFLLASREMPREGLLLWLASLFGLLCWFSQFGPRSVPKLQFPPFPRRD
jgi:hypothetical protein